METLQTGHYPIHFGLEAIAKLPLEGYSKVLVLCDDHTREHCLPLLQSFLPAHELITVRPGEGSKSFTTLEEVISSMVNLKLDRGSLLLNLGGGMITDLGGLAASLFHRGIAFIHVPTSLLAMLDATIGGKTGVNVRGGKNLAGTFNNPTAVVIHPGFLQTLPRRELRAGQAEALKHALIADAAHWRDLTQQDFPPADVTPLIRRSLEIKLSIVEQDPLEKGIRKALNFGHTLGHALETLCMERTEPLLHGEAVAVGMLMEAWLSLETGRLSDEAFHEIRECITSRYNHVPLSEDDVQALLQLVTLDKKNQSSELRFTLLKAIGQHEVNVTIPMDLVEKAILHYRAS